MKNKCTLSTLCFSALVTASHAALTITFSEGAAPDEINYTLSGSNVWNGGAIAADADRDTHLPTVDSQISPRWDYTDESPWDSSVTPFIGDFRSDLNVGSTIQFFVDGNLIPNLNGPISGGAIFLDADPGGEFSFRAHNSTDSWQFPALSGGEVISWSGSGSFTRTGGLAANTKNPGTYSYSDSGGITLTAIVVPEPSGALFVALGGLIVFSRRREKLPQSS